MKSSQKKILFYTKDLNGGIAQFLEKLVPLLEKNGWQVQLICHQTSHAYALSPKFIGQKIERQYGFSIKNILIDCINLYSLFIYLKKSETKIIYSLDLYANINSVLAKMFFSNKIFILSTHANLLGYLSDRQPIFRNFLLWLCRHLYHFCDLHLVPSAGLKNQLTQLLFLPPSQIINIPSFLNTHKIINLSQQTITDQVLKRKLYKKGIIKIFTMSRLERQKKINLLFPIIKANKNYQLFLIGTGPDKKKYLKQINRLKITKQVTFLDWQDNPYIFLRLADVFISISSYEGFPCALLEAMVLGRPVIASDVDFGPREILTQYSGILLQNNKSTTISQAITTILKKKYFFRQHARKRANDFDTKKIFPLYLDVLERLVKRSS